MLKFDYLLIENIIVERGCRFLFLIIRIVLSGKPKGQRRSTTIN